MTTKETLKHAEKMERAIIAVLAYGTDFLCFGKQEEHIVYDENARTNLIEAQKNLTKLLEVYHEDIEEELSKGETALSTKLRIQELAKQAGEICQFIPRITDKHSSVINAEHFDALLISPVSEILGPHIRHELTVRNDLKQVYWKLKHIAAPDTLNGPFFSVSNQAEENFRQALHRLHKESPPNYDILCHTVRKFNEAIQSNEYYEKLPALDIDYPPEEKEAALQPLETLLTELDQSLFLPLPEKKKKQAFTKTRIQAGDQASEELLETLNKTKQTLGPYVTINGRVITLNNPKIIEGDLTNEPHFLHKGDVVVMGNIEDSQLLIEEGRLFVGGNIENNYSINAQSIFARGDIKGESQNIIASNKVHAGGTITSHIVIKGKEKPLQNQRLEMVLPGESPSKWTQKVGRKKTVEVKPTIRLNNRTRDLYEPVFKGDDLEIKEGETEYHWHQDLVILGDLINHGTLNCRGLVVTGKIINHGYMNVSSIASPETIQNFGRMKSYTAYTNGSLDNRKDGHASIGKLYADQGLRNEGIATVQQGKPTKKREVVEFNIHELMDMYEESQKPKKSFWSRFF